MANVLLFLFSLLGLLQLTVQQGPECSATQRCPIGCCSKSGYCGTGPDYCGEGCLSTCDFKSDCNPGWDSSLFSKSETCPLNVCCSKFGFCGTTEDFCDGKKVERPSCKVGDNEITRVIGYYEAWSTTNRPCYNMLPEEVPYGYYTDIIFSFATVDPNTFEIKAGDSKTKEFMKRISAIKLMQPDIKIWIAVGGWAFNDPGPTQSTFGEMAASPAATKAFIDSVIKMMNKYSFDGIDIDWEYPGAEDRFGEGRDFKNFVSFMKALTNRMHAGDQKKMVSLTLPASFWYLQHFDIRNLQNFVDWFNIMSYDVHGSWDIDSKWNPPVANAHTNMTELQDALDLLWRNDIDPKKVTFGMSFYSRTFTLSNAACNRAGCPVASGGIPGSCSDTTGVMLHPEIAEIVSKHRLIPLLDREAAVKSVSWGDQWTAYDDLATWRLKSNIIRGQCIPGVMVWAMSQDDKQGTNIKALTSAVGRRQMEIPKFTPAEPVTEAPPKVAKLCRWSGCYRECPAGFKTVQRNGHKEIIGSGEKCLAGGFDKLCCPADQPMPVCEWRGHKNSGVCSPGCKGSEVAVGSLNVGCNIKHQTACCSNVASTASYGDCKWVGTAPSCNSDCPSDYPNKIVSTKQGSGGEQPCLTGAKSYCCRDPKPSDFFKCDWYSKEEPRHFNQDLICEDSCPSGRIKLATDSGTMSGQNGCYGGARAFCCEPAKALVPRDEEKDPFGGKQNKEFQKLLEKYMEYPTCPATLIHPSPGDIFKQAETKRSLQVEAAETRLLKGRATDCELDRFERMVAFASLMITVTDSMLEPLSVVYDELFADSYDEVLRATNLRSHFNSFPNIDPGSYMRALFLSPTTAGEVIRRESTMSQVFCQPSGVTSKKKREDKNLVEEPRRLLNSAKRWVWWRLTPSPEDDPHPDITETLGGILNGDLSLHYARWEHSNAQGPFLEMAYWIGSQPGEPGGDNLYRDPVRQEEYGGREDRWVVFHFHIDMDLEFLRTFDGRTHIGISSVQVFHGYRLIHGGPWRPWRVDGWERRARNSRDGFGCPEDLLWYPGTASEPPPLENPDRTPNTLLIERFQAWGQSLFDDGYMSSETIGMILTGSTYTENGDIDPDNPGQLVSWDQTHPEWHQRMWQLNFVINQQGFDFAPLEPAEW